MNDINRALRNHMIVQWWDNLPAHVRDFVLKCYCTYLGGCPMTEIDPDMLGPNDLDWLWDNYGNLIQKHTDAQL